MFNYSRVLDMENKSASFVTSELPEEYTKIWKTAQVSKHLEILYKI
jgi:hypothetical protein